jgi:molecular chaperone HtpG
MKDGQDKIYYILGDDDHSVIRSPHLDFFRENGYEVALFTDPIDSFMLMGLRKYSDFDLVNVASPNLELPEVKENLDEETQHEILPDAELDPLVERFKSHLGERVTDVRATDRLRNSVARLVDPEGTMEQEMQRVYRYLEREYDVPKKVLELNPKHPIITHLSSLDEEDELGDIIIDQIYDSALLIEGLHPDPASMLPRIQDLMEKALGQ